MCDTILAPPSSTRDHILLFGKNSDRQRNEAQTVEYSHRAEHAADAKVTCTYISIPQVERTHAVLLCRPFWIWGAEMGANEYGVVIGNEGLHARAPPPEKEALTGMDILRLALERASTAAEAVDVVTTLLERYDQGGNCGHLVSAYYNNGFAIADGSEAFVLETVGREWLVERVRGLRALSNRYSIGHDVQARSPGISALAQNLGWSAKAESSYADALADPGKEHLGNSAERHAHSTSLLRSREGTLGAADMMAILRDHGSGDGFHPEWRLECMVKRTLCMHAGADDRPGQTVGSMVLEIYAKDAVHWVTGTAAPCSAIFKPIIMGVPFPPNGPRPTDRFDSRTLWWRHERLHRAAILRDFGQFLGDIRAERDALETEFRARVRSVLGGSKLADRAQVVAECWKDAFEVEDRWWPRMAEVPLSEPDVPGWGKRSRLAGIDASFPER